MDYEKSDVYLQTYLEAVMRTLNTWGLQARYSADDKDDTNTVTLRHTLTVRSIGEIEAPYILVEAGDWACLTDTEKEEIRNQFRTDYRKIQSSGVYVRATFQSDMGSMPRTWKYRYIRVEFDQQARYLATSLSARKFS